MTDRLCSNTDCINKGIHLCSNCSESIYCSKECQKSHWPIHKSLCKSAIKPESVSLLQSFELLSVKQLKNLLLRKISTFESKKRDSINRRLDNMVDKSDLIQLVKQYIDTDEIDTLLNEKKAKPEKSNEKVSTKNNAIPNPTPEQLKQQAAMMKSNPDLVRKSNQIFSKMTDQQIIQYAEQLEKAASDPSMMKEIEKMSSLSQSDREQLQYIQEGLSGQKPMNKKWINKIVSIIKNNNNLIKFMFAGKGQLIGGVNDEQINSFIDSISKFNTNILYYAIYIMIYISNSIQPLTILYNQIDKYLFGLTKYLILGIVILIIYGIFLFNYYIFKFFYNLIKNLLFPTIIVKNQTESIKVAETVVNDIKNSILNKKDDEFEF